MKINLFSNLREKRITLEELLVMSNEIQALHTNTKIDGGRYRHTLPLIDAKKDYLSPENWDLDKKVIEDIQEKRKFLGKYASTMDKKYHSQLSKGKKIQEQLFPPWVVFPLYDARSLGWRMGAGEAYTLLFSMFFVSLSLEEKDDYKKKYPLPEYIKMNYGHLYGLSEDELLDISKENN